MSDIPEKIVKDEIIYLGKLLKIYRKEVQTPNGKHFFREVVSHQGAVAVIALTKENKIVLVKQYRVAVKDFTYELPAGLINPTETYEACGARELKEETGFVPEQLKVLLSAYASPGYSNEVITYVLALDSTAGQASPEEDESTQPILFSIDEALKLVESGKIKDNKTIVGLLLAEKIINPEPNMVQGKGKNA